MCTTGSSKIDCECFKLERDDIAGGFRLMGLVLTHPSGDADMIEQAKAQIVAKRRDLNQAEVEAFLAKVNGLDPEAVVVELLEEFTQN